MINKKGDWKLVFIFAVAVLVISLATVLLYGGSITSAAIAGITSGPIGNQSKLNCSVNAGASCSAGFTKILGLYNSTNSHVELPNQNNFNYSLCCAATVSGVTINITNTNSTASFNFLDLFQINNSHVEIPNGSLFYHNSTSYTTVNYTSKYNVSAFISTSTGEISCNYYENLFGNCTHENETCLLTIPTDTYGGNTTNLHVSSCNNSVAYNTSVCCALKAEFDLTILIDGNETNFTNVGETYNVTVITGEADNFLIKAEECNGLSPFSLIQSIDSNVTNCAYTEVETGPDGQVSYTHVPSGAAIYSSPFDYTIKFQAIRGGTIEGEKNLTAINRDPVPAAYSKSSLVVNKPNVEGTNERILIIFDRIARSKIGNTISGETFDMIIYDNGTATGTNVNFTSGRPTGLNITVLNSTGSPIPSTTIIAREDSGLMHWGLIQYEAAGATANVSNYVEGTTTTNNNGNVQFTIIPTSGFVSSDVDQAIGNYSVTLLAILPNGTTIFNNTFNIDRTLPQPSPTSSIPNSAEIEGLNEKILILFDRVSKYIT